jgi:protein-tyrosine phosphatase
MHNKILLFLLITAHLTDCSYSFKSGYNLLKSMATFHYSIYVKYKNEFTFNEIIPFSINEKTSVTFDANNNITAITDGKKSSIILGGIPRTEEHIGSLKKQFGKESNIAFFSLNRQFERDWSGYSALFKNNSDKKQLFLYPTTDHEVPSLIDLLRAVRDLDNRDEHNIELTYVHCKAGRGRSALVIGAYLCHVLHKAKIPATPEQIEQYLRLKRSAVNLNQEQRNTLRDFNVKLQHSGGLENLLTEYQEEIGKRDISCSPVTN